MGSIIRATGTIFYSLLYLNSRIGFNGLKYLYSVISVIEKRLPGNTTKWTLVSSWTARVRLVHSWADIYTYIYIGPKFWHKIFYMCLYIKIYIYISTHNIYMGPKFSQMIFYMYFYIHIHICISTHISIWALSFRRRSSMHLYIRLSIYKSTHRYIYI